MQGRLGSGALTRSSRLASSSQRRVLAIVAGTTVGRAFTVKRLPLLAAAVRTLSVTLRAGIPGTLQTILRALQRT